jgi:cobalt/nickel transport system permease protein
MVLLTPLGLLAPGGAFGEQAPGNLDLGGLGLQAVPAGLARYNGLWAHALLGGYGFAGGHHATLGYILSAVVGITVVALMIYVIGRLVEYVVKRRAAANDGAAEATRV